MSSQSSMWATGVRLLRVTGGRVQRSNLVMPSHPDWLLPPSWSLGMTPVDLHSFNKARVLWAHVPQEAAFASVPSQMAGESI